MSPNEIAALVELTEGDAYEAILLAPPPDVTEELGIRVARFGSARARLVESVNITLLNAVVGLGVGEPATEEMVDEIIEFYRPHGVNFMIQVSPRARPVGFSGWLEERGFEYRDEWVKMYRGVEPAPVAATDLEIREVLPESGEVFAETVLKGYEMPPAAQVLVPVLAAGVGKPGWRHYLGYDGKVPVASGGLYVKDSVAWLGYGATLPSHRRRGAQGGLFSRRIADAIDMGCRWLVTETDAEIPGQPSISYHNMVRAGFKEAYNRPNYVWRAGM
jgi:GNAT superfamily N-acetyltransferase